LENVVEFQQFRRCRRSLLYAESLHDYFGRGANDCMKRLKALQREVSGAG